MPMGHADPADHIIINKLPATFDDSSLLELCGSIGATVKWHMLQQDKFSEGKCAIVELGSVDEATLIVDNFNDTVPMGGSIPMEIGYKRQKSGGDKGGGKAKGGKPKGAWNGGGGGGKGAWPGGGKQQPMVQWSPPPQQLRPAPYSQAVQVKGGGNTVYSGKDMINDFINGNLLPGGNCSIKDMMTSNGHAIIIDNYPEGTTELDLYQLFAPFGSLSPNGIHMNPQKGYTLVHYQDAEASSLAIVTLNEAELPTGMMLHVKPFTHGAGV